MKSKILLIALFIFCFTSYNYWKNWAGGKHPFYSDVDQYYSYVVAGFIKHDLSFSFPNSYWLQPAPNGNFVPKVSMGMAYIYTPFFLICEAIALIQGDDKGGYSDTHAYGLMWMGILAVLVGLLGLRKVLLRYFNERVTTYTLATLFLATNLFFHTFTQNLTPHVWLFAFFTWITYWTVRWYETYRWKYMLLIGFFMGFCVLLRPTEIFYLLVPALFGIKSFGDIKPRVNIWLTYWPQILCACLMALLPWIPQMIYWKYYTGSWFFWTYTEEGFYFKNPQFYNVLFGFRKGWLIYTPMMVTAVLGFFVMRKYIKDLFVPTLLFFLITLYLISSWWCWWWGGCFAMRALVQSYALLAFPVASLWMYAIEKKWWLRILQVFLILNIAYNMHMTWKFNHNIIHWDSMTKEAYMWSFFKSGISPADTVEYYPLLQTPDYSKKGDK